MKLFSGFTESGMNSLPWNGHQIHAESGWLPQQQPCHYCTTEHLLPGVVVHIIHNLVRSSKSYLLQHPAEHLPVTMKISSGRKRPPQCNFLFVLQLKQVLFSAISFITCLWWSAESGGNSLCCLGASGASSDQQLMRRWSTPSTVTLFNSNMALEMTLSSKAAHFPSTFSLIF